MTDDFQEELWRRWEQGQEEGKQLFAEIRQRVYIGSYATLIGVSGIVAGGAGRCEQGFTMCGLCHDAPPGFEFSRHPLAR